MDEAARKERNTYMREWRQKHQDQVKAAQKRYWERRVRKKASDSKIVEGKPDEIHCYK